MWKLILHRPVNNYLGLATDSSLGSSDHAVHTRMSYALQSLITQYILTSHL